MSLKGKRVAVLAEADYEDLELLYPWLRLKEAGAEVHVVGTGSATTYSEQTWLSRECGRRTPMRSRRRITMPSSCRVVSPRIVCAAIRPY